MAKFSVSSWIKKCFLRKYRYCLLHLPHSLPSISFKIYFSPFINADSPHCCSSPCLYLPRRQFNPRGASFSCSAQDNLISTRLNKSHLFVFFLTTALPAGLSDSLHLTVLVMVLWSIMVVKGIFLILYAVWHKWRTFTLKQRWQRCSDLIIFNGYTFAPGIFHHIYSQIGLFVHFLNILDFSTQILKTILSS